MSESLSLKFRVLLHRFLALGRKFRGGLSLAGRSDVTDEYDFDEDIVRLQSIARKLITNYQLRPEEIDFFVGKTVLAGNDSFLILLISHPLLNTDTSSRIRKGAITLCKNALLDISNDLGSKYLFYIIDAMNSDHFVSAIIAWNSGEMLNEDVAYARLEDGSKEMLLRISENTGEKLKLAIGPVLKDMQYIHYSLGRAHGILQKIFDEQNIYVLSDVDVEIHSAAVRQKTKQLDTQFLCCLVCRKFPEAMELMLESLTLEANELVSSIIMLRRFAEEKFNVLMRAMGLSEDYNHGLGSDFWRKTIKKFEQSENYNELKDNINAAIESVRNDYREDDTEYVKIKKYTEYIMKNYTDPNLSAQMVCYQFDIAPSLLSRMFKRDTGMGVLEYIHAIRLDHAKMLLETDMKIDEIAVKAGYHTRRGLDTVFKRSYGISPSEYRTALPELK